MCVTVLIATVVGGDVLSLVIHGVAVDNSMREHSIQAQSVRGVTDYVRLNAEQALHLRTYALAKIMSVMLDNEHTLDAVHM